MKTRWLVLPLIGGLLLMGFFAMKLMGPVPLNAPGLANNTLPFSSFKTIAGDNFSFQDYLGKRYVVHIWSSWCSSCDYDHQTLMGLVTPKMTLIGLTYRDSPEAAMKYLMQYGNPYEAVIDDQNSELAPLLRVGAVPMTLWIDEKGVVIHQALGLLTHHDIETLKHWATPGVGTEEDITQ